MSEVEITADPNIVIVDRGVTPDGDSFVTYRWINYMTGHTPDWTVLGTCICCGLCEVGANNPYLEWKGEPGISGSCVDTRWPNLPDVPVSPAFFDMLEEPCTLRFGGFGGA